MKRIIHENKDAGIRQFFHMNDEGDIGLQTVQDVTDIVEDNKASFNATDERAKWGEGQKIASIPMAVYYDLKNRGIIGDDAKFKAWLNSPDNRFFRTRPGRV